MIFQLNENYCNFYGGIFICPNKIYQVKIKSLSQVKLMTGSVSTTYRQQYFIQNTVVILNPHCDSFMPLLFTVVIGIYCILSLQLSILIPRRAFFILDFCVRKISNPLFKEKKKNLSRWCYYWIIWIIPLVHPEKCLLILFSASIPKSML